MKIRKSRRRVSQSEEEPYPAISGGTEGLETVSSTDFSLPAQTPGTGESTPLEGSEPFRIAKDEFVAQWGAIGSAWGINRTMAQIHALLITTPSAMTTDGIMAELGISRGNAHGNLRELVTWGLVRSIVRKGERKEYFEAEKDPWKMFCIISRERRRRELQPAMVVLEECFERTCGLNGPEVDAFNNQIKALSDFLKLTDDVISKVANSKESRIIPWAMKFLT